jgi:hypothetical protein
MNLYNGCLYYPVENHHKVINHDISFSVKEIISILTISYNGKKREIRFLCDGNETKSSDVSVHWKGDRLCPAISQYWKNQRITTIPIDEIKTRTPEIDELIEEYQEQQNPIQIPLLPSVSNEINNQVISQLRRQISDDQRILIREKDKQIQEMRRNLEAQAKNSEIQAKNFEAQLKHLRFQMEESRKDFLKQLESKDHHFQREREIFNKQINLERAENQQLRNLLQHKKTK